MEQGGYARYVSELHTILGDGLGPELASKFVEGTTDLITRKIAHSELDDKYSLHDLLKALAWVTGDAKGLSAEPITEKGLEEQEDK